jgi:hypothetical protein
MEATTVSRVSAAKENASEAVDLYAGRSDIIGQAWVVPSRLVLTRFSIPASLPLLSHSANATFLGGTISYNAR